MAIVEPFTEQGVYSGNLGKDIPGMGPFKNFKPNLQGPGSGKIKFAILVGGKLVWYYKERVAGVATGIAIGTGASLDGTTSNTVNETLQPVYSNYSRFRNNPKYKLRYRCTCRRRDRSKPNINSRRKYR